MIELAASVLGADFARLGEQLREAFAAGVRRVHVDVMDGQFVPNLSMGPEVLSAVRRVCDEAGATIAVHLMITEPQRFVKKFVEAGAHRVVVHVEGAPLLTRTLAQIQELGAEPSVAINPSTPLSMLEEVLDRVCSVLVMSVEPGFGGQAFDPKSLNKVARLRRMLDEARLGEVAIAVDGGISPATIGAVARAGAHYAVAGSALFGGTGSIAENVRALQAAARGGAEGR